MSTSSDHPIVRVVRVVRRIPFPAERVFDAWLDPALAAKWLFSTPTGKMVRAEVDPRVGGRYTFTERRDGEDVEHTGEYLEIDRPRRLVFTFGVPKYSPDFNRVTVEIEPQGDGCQLTLTQEMLPQWAHYQHRTTLGWGMILENLAANLGDKRAATNREFGERTGPDSMRLVRLLPGPIERVWKYLTDADKRAKWFAGGTMEPCVGGKCALVFRHANLSPGETPPEKYREVHDPGISTNAEITKFEPPRLLTFLWEEEPGRSTEVSFELTPQGDDVQLVLTHRFLATPQELRSVSGGWHLHTAILDALLSGSTPPPLWAAHERLEAEYGKRLGVE